MPRTQCPNNIVWVEKSMTNACGWFCFHKNELQAIEVAYEKVSFEAVNKTASHLCVYTLYIDTLTDTGIHIDWWLLNCGTMYNAQIPHHTYCIHTGYKYNYNMQSFKVWWWIAENYDGLSSYQPHFLSLVCSLSHQPQLSSVHTIFIWIRESFFISMESIVIAYLHKLSLDAIQIGLVHVYVCFMWGILQIWHKMWNKVSMIWLQFQKLLIGGHIITAILLKRWRL